MKQKLPQSKRICVILDKDVHMKVRLLQSKLITENQKAISCSNAINHALRKSLEKNNGRLY